MLARRQFARRRSSRRLAAARRAAGLGVAIGEAALLERPATDCSRHAGSARRPIAASAPRRQPPTAGPRRGATAAWRRLALAGRLPSAAPPVLRERRPAPAASRRSLAAAPTPGGLARSARRAPAAPARVADIQRGGRCGGACRSRACAAPPRRAARAEARAWPWSRARRATQRRARGARTRVAGARAQHAHAPAEAAAAGAAALLAPRPRGASRAGVVARFRRHRRAVSAASPAAAAASPPPWRRAACRARAPRRSAASSAVAPHPCRVPCRRPATRAPPPPPGASAAAARRAAELAEVRREAAAAAAAAEGAPPPETNQHAGTAMAQLFGAVARGGEEGSMASRIAPSVWRRRARAMAASPSQPATMPASRLRKGAGQCSGGVDPAGGRSEPPHSVGGRQLETADWNYAHGAARRQQGNVPAASMRLAAAASRG